MIFNNNKNSPNFTAAGSSCGMIVYRNAQMKTPLYSGVLSRFGCFILYLGNKSGRPEFIPIYQIYAALDSSLCSFESKDVASGC
jgi:hypothetical protein